MLVRFNILLALAYFVIIRERKVQRSQMSSCYFVWLLIKKISESIFHFIVLSFLTEKNSSRNIVARQRSAPSSSHIDLFNITNDFQHFGKRLSEPCFNVKMPECFSKH